MGLGNLMGALQSMAGGSGNDQAFSQVPPTRGKEDWPRHLHMHSNPTRRLLSAKW